MDTFNILQVLALLSERCNYHSTMQGVFVGNHIHDYIRTNFSSPWNDIAGWTWIIWEVIITLADDLIVVGMTGVALYEHWDFYNIARIVGKLMKLGIQFKIYGFIDWVLEL